MRRAFVKGVRLTHRGLTNSRPFQIPSPNHALSLGLRLISSTPRRDLSPAKATLIAIQSSSMYFRNLSLALVSTVVATGAYYVYHSSPIGHVPDNSNSTSSSQTSTNEATRLALIVDNENFYTGTIPSDAHLEKITDGSGRKVLEMLTPDQATVRLRTNEESYHVHRGRGVVRYDIVQIPSNDPIEDDHVEKVVEVPASPSLPHDSPPSDWMFWGVFDGHSGWTTSAKLRNVLVSFVARELSPLYKSPAPPTNESIDAALRSAFLALDHEIIHTSVQSVLKANTKRLAAELLAPALSGSCALLSFYDSSSQLLRVACTGDSRAVLGRRSSVHPERWTATPLSVDQTGSNEEEAARLRREHPGEEHVVRNGRILGGLEPSRAFGDSSYKWSRVTQEKIKSSFFGRTPSVLLRTPPYVTAEPVVTTTKIEPSQGDFVVMATDGLWEMLTNEEVIGLVGQWLDSQPASSHPLAEQHELPAKSWLNSWFSTSAGLPVEGATGDGGDIKPPLRQRQWGIPPAKHPLMDERFVVEDRNAATHLVRNALGGKDRDMVSALLTLPAPYARRYRYVLTLLVDVPSEHTKQIPSVTI